MLENLFEFGAILGLPSLCDPKMYPIHWAASDGKTESIRFFLDHRQDINCLDASGCSPLIIATQYNQLQVAIMLLKNSADTSIKDGNGDSALHWAAYKGFEEMTGLLMHFMPRELEVEDVYGQVRLFY